MTKVLELPPRESLRIQVRTESRYGTKLAGLLGLDAVLLQVDELLADLN